MQLTFFHWHYTVQHWKLHILSSRALTTQGKVWCKIGISTVCMSQHSEVYVFCYWHLHICVIQHESSTFFDSRTFKPPNLLAWQYQTLYNIQNPKRYLVQDPKPQALSDSKSKASSAIWYNIQSSRLCLVQDSKLQTLSGTRFKAHETMCTFLPASESSTPNHAILQGHIRISHTFMYTIVTVFLHIFISPLK